MKNKSCIYVSGKKNQFNVLDTHTERRKVILKKEEKRYESSTAEIFLLLSSFMGVFDYLSLNCTQVVCCQERIPCQLIFKMVNQMHEQFGIFALYILNRATATD